MKTKKAVFFALTLVLTVVGLAVGPAQARQVRTEFTGTEAFVADLSPGTETFPDKTLYHVRDAISVFAIQTTDPRVSGEDRVVIDWNFKMVDPPVFVTGRMWGTFTITNAGGYWAGNFTGVRDRKGYSYFKFEGKGYGDYKGMKLHMRIQRLTPDPTQPEEISGYILEAEK